MAAGLGMREEEVREAEYGCKGRNEDQGRECGRNEDQGRECGRIEDLGRECSLLERVVLAGSTASL